MDSVTSYYSKMKDAWNELDIMAPMPHCGCEESRQYIEHLRSQRLLQYVMGLNESYSQIRSSILSKGPATTVNESYAIAAQEETQRTLGVVDGHKEALSLLAGRTQAYRGQNRRSNTVQPPKRFDLFCELCGYRNHLKKDC